MKTALRRLRFWHRNAETCSGDDQPCALCGLPIRTARAWVWVVDGGDRVATTDERIDPSGDLGFHPIGPGCAAKAWVKPYVLSHPSHPNP